MFRILFVCSIVILLASCVTGNYFPSGGSRADGTVELVCNYDALTRCYFEPTPEMNLDAGRLCKNWGYERAQTFGGYINVPGLSGTGQVKISYQCLGDLEK